LPVSSRAVVPRYEIDELIDDEPARELKWGGLVIFVFFGLFLGWAFFARLDAAAYAQGQIAVAGHRQAVQHKEGGRIAALKVKEGQHVEAGQVLLVLEGADVEAQERAVSSQVIDLQAQRARLEAERGHSPDLTPPPEFASLTGADKAEAERALKLQRNELAARAVSLANSKAVLNQRSAQLRKQIEGLTQQMGSTKDQSKLIGEELANIKELQAQGYASVNRVRELQRTEAALRGAQSDLSANAAKSGEQIGEVQMQSLGLDTQRQEDVAKELRDVDYQLGDLLPKMIALKSQLAKTQIQAPASGEVVGLSVFTVGGVIAPGQKILEVVPDSTPLIIEANISPTDADDLYVGQKAEVKIAAFHERDLPVLKGEVTRISADSFSDEHSGQKYFTAEVTVPPSELTRIETARGNDRSMKAGLPVQVLIPLRKRTAFQYLTEPLTQAVWRSFREH
jgi:HlyD family secretion protein